MIGHDCLIGILQNWEDTKPTTFQGLKNHIKEQEELENYSVKLGYKREKTYTLSDYCDRRKSTDLFRFNYCPVCAKKIEWDKIKSTATE